MVKPEAQKQQASRKVWLNAALEVLRERGVDGIKAVPLANRLGLTSGSFYWHFRNEQDLLDSIFEHWENHLTDHIVRDAQQFDGSLEKRILNLMLQVIREDADVPDHAISVWVKSDANAQISYCRAVAKRFEFAKWMSEQVGFTPQEATARGRLMVTSLLGESSNNLKAIPDWEVIFRTQWRSS
jgi:AcrR family transcriptional regulator